MKEKMFERQIYDIQKELKDEVELKKKLHEIYFSNLEENLHLLLKDQINFLNDLSEKTKYCLIKQFAVI